MKLKCGCEIKCDWFEHASIQFCPLHQAAGDLREACEQALIALTALQNGKTVFAYHYVPILEQALAKAKEKP